MPGTDTWNGYSFGPLHLLVKAAHKLAINVRRPPHDGNSKTHINPATACSPESTQWLVSSQLSLAALVLPELAITQKMCLLLSLKWHTNVAAAAKSLIPNSAAMASTDRWPLFSANRPFADLRKYVIVRDIPGIGSKTPEELQGISQTSCKALRQTGLDTVQWVHSYVTGDK